MLFLRCANFSLFSLIFNLIFIVIVVINFVINFSKNSSFNFQNFLTNFYMILIFLPWNLFLAAGIIFQLFGYFKKFWHFTLISSIFYLVSILISSKEIKYVFYFITILTFIAAVQERSRVKRSEAGRGVRTPAAGTECGVSSGA